jgi:uncharacterized membrane protein YjfL (UPF0719 family)
MLPRPDRPHDQLLTPMTRLRAVRAESIWAALGGALAGYVLWLVAISIGDAVATVGVWGPIVLIVSVAFAVVTTVWGRRLRRSGNATLASAALASSVLPVVLSLLVVADSYL